MQALKKSTILIVDDTPTNIRVLMELLKGDYAILAATNGPKALELARGSKRPDLILLDIMMEGMDGYEVCRTLQSRPETASIPVIFITALSQESDEKKGLSTGAVDYITKPFRPEIVKARVNTHLELKRYRDSLEDLVAEQVEQIAASHLATIFALSKLAESRDDDTGKHLERTQIYCKILAEQLRGTFQGQIDDDFIETIFHASPLHDIGKVSIPDAVLCKPGKLTSEEFELMKTHTVKGAETLQKTAATYTNNNYLQMGLEIARSHHEKWDGSGYPNGLRGEEIPLEASIMAVADVYDALTSKRCYKEAFSHEIAKAIILESRGSHFDPRLVDAFLAVEQEFNQVRARLQEG